MVSQETLNKIRKNNLNAPFYREEHFLYKNTYGKVQNSKT